MEIKDIKTHDFSEGYKQQMQCILDLIEKGKKYEVPEHEVSLAMSALGNYSPVVGELKDYPKACLSRIDEDCNASAEGCPDDVIASTKINSSYDFAKNFRTFQELERKISDGKYN